MRLFLNTILISITILACFIGDIYLYFWPPQPNQTAYLTIRSHHSFSFDQQTELDVKRQTALARYIPVYRYAPQAVEASINKFEAFMKTVEAFSQKGPKAADALRSQLQQEFGVRFSTADMVQIVNHRDLKNLLQGILTIEESVLQNKIIQNLGSLKGKETILIINPGAIGTGTQPVSALIQLDKARLLLEDKIRQFFWQVDKRVLNPVVMVSQATLKPNLEYDQAENQRRLDNINREFPSQTVSYEPGEVLVPFHRILNEKDVLLLESYLKHKLDWIYRDLSRNVYTILLVVGFFNLFLSKILANGSRRRPPDRFALVLLITTVIVLVGYLALTPFPIYGLPFCALPMLIIFLNHGKIVATATTLAGATLVCLLAGPTYEILLFLAFGGFAAVLISYDLRKRLQIIRPSLLVGFVNALTVLIFAIDWQAVYSEIISLQTVQLAPLMKIFDEALTRDIAWGTIGGLIAGPLALLLLPLLEIGWGTASNFKLNRYTDLNQVLMKELLSKAPGTYQHSMTVAYLAQSAGAAIGADTLLLRVGAYYHDVGKMMNPNLFIENQFDGENPHDVLEPRESARIIIKHVRHGMRIGQEAGLPKVVVDLLVQHHGTQLMEYFYNIAARTYPKSTIQEAEFRYPGPKPHSVEAAVLMIADAVEAASRSIEDPNRKKFTKMVRLIILKRIVDGQFSDCDLSSRDLPKIVDALVDALEASFHSRVRYPWQGKRRPPKRQIGRSARIPETTGRTAPFVCRDLNLRMPETRFAIS